MTAIKGNHDVCQPGCGLSRGEQSQVTWWRYAFCLIISSRYGNPRTQEAGEFLSEFEASLIYF